MYIGIIVDRKLLIFNMEDKKIKLRPVEPIDLELLYQWENDPDNWIISGTTTPYSKNTLKNYLFSIQDIYHDKQLRLIITANDKEVGVLDLFEYDQKNSRVGIGILIDKKHRSQGFGKKAIKKAIKYCFETLFVHQVYCNIMISNPNSIKLFLSLGFELCGEKKDWIQTPQGWINENTYQLIKNQ